MQGNASRDATRQAEKKWQRLVRLSRRQPGQPNVERTPPEVRTNCAHAACDLLLDVEFYERRVRLAVVSKNRMPCGASGDLDLVVTRSLLSMSFLPFAQ